VNERAPLDEQEASVQCSQQSARLRNIVMLLALRLPAERGYELKGERLSRKISIRVEARPEISQKDKNVTSMERMTDKIVSEDEVTRSIIFTNT